MQFSLKRLLLLTVIVAWMFGWVGRYWPVGTAAAVVVCVATGVVLLAFGTVRSWRLVVWVVAVFLGSLIGSRLGLPLHSRIEVWPVPAVEACSLLLGAVLFGVVAFMVLVFLARKSATSRLEDVVHDER